MHAAMLDEYAAVDFDFSSGETATVLAAPEETTPGPSVAALPNGLRKEVLGFLPYWKLDASDLQWMRYDLVSTIAYFSVGARSDGYLDKGSSASPTTGWAAWTSSAMTDVINRAHARGVRVVLTVTMMAYDGGAAQDALLSNATYRSRLVQEIVAAVRLRNADGVNLDFEPVYTAQRSEYTAFVREVKAGLLRAGVGSYLTVCTTGGAATWSTGYDVAALTAPGAADHLFVMGYDYSWSGSARAGAVAPYESPYMLDITSSLNDYLRLTSPSKIIWGVPYYGRSWPTQTNQLNSLTRPPTATSYSTAWSYTIGLDAAARYGRRWDPVGRVPWFVWWDAPNATYRQGYYDDATSLAYKYDLLKQRGVAGTGMWHLLMDQGRSELWWLIGNRFIDGVPPRVASSMPVGSTTQIPPNITVRVWFSEPVTGVAAGNFVLRDGRSAIVPATVSYDAASRSATLRPHSPLAAGQRYSVALSGSIRDLLGNPLPWTSWAYTTAPAGSSAYTGETYAPARTVGFAAGTHTGYRFDSAGRVTASKIATLTRYSSAATSARRRQPGLSGVWLCVTNGVWAGYWVRESYLSYVVGLAAQESFEPPKTASFGAGTHTGYVFGSTGAVTARKAYTLPRASSAAAGGRAVVNGRRYLLITNGVWAGYWVPESTTVRLL